MSSETASELGVRSITGLELEAMYLRHGTHGAGRAMEVRQTWKFNDLTPRTYFAMGSQAYIHSKYAQAIFNRLIDSFAVSHRRQRFDLERLDLSDIDDVWVYDYSSFTSNFTEQKYFLQELGEYCLGYPLKVFDTHFGEQTLDLGVYILEYLEHTSVMPEFYLGPALCTRLDLPPLRFSHRRAGALGVYGNLASCTVLHGLVSMNITGSVRKSSVVGDDGLAVVTPYFPEEGEIPPLTRTLSDIKGALRLLGEINDGKFATLSAQSSSGWTYLKRALRRVDNKLILWKQEHVFNLAFLLDRSTETYRKGNIDSLAGIKSLLGQVFTLLLRINRFPHEYQDDDLADICLILRSIYLKLGLPLQGTITGCTITLEKRGLKQNPGHRNKKSTVRVRHLVCQIPPPSLAHRLRDDPLEVLLRDHDFSSEPIYVPRMIERHSFIDPPQVGGSIRCNKTRSLKLLEAAGFVSSSVPESVVCSSAEDFRYFRELLIRPSLTMEYEYYFKEELPSHFVDILHR